MNIWRSMHHFKFGILICIITNPCFFFLLGFGNMFPSLFWLNNKYYISRDELFHL